MFPGCSSCTLSSPLQVDPNNTDFKRSGTSVPMGCKSCTYLCMQPLCKSKPKRDWQSIPRNQASSNLGSPQGPPELWKHPDQTADTFILHESHMTCNRFNEVRSLCCFNPPGLPSPTWIKTAAPICINSHWKQNAAATIFCNIQNSNKHPVPSIP